LVNAVWGISQTQFVQFQRFAVEPCVLKTDFVGDVKRMGSENMTMYEQNDFIELNLGKGETAILYVGEKSNVFKSTDLPITKNEKNQWGVRNSSSFKELDYEINKIILTAYR
jgi:alpha-L-fucosidase 2